MLTGLANFLIDYPKAQSEGASVTTATYAAGGIWLYAAQRGFEMPPRGGFILPETLVLAGLRFRQHYRDKSEIGFPQG